MELTRIAYFNLFFTCFTVLVWRTWKDYWQSLRILKFYHSPVFFRVPGRHHFKYFVAFYLYFPIKSKQLIILFSLWFREKTDMWKPKIVDLYFFILVIDWKAKLFLVVGAIVELVGHLLALIQPNSNPIWSPKPNRSVPWAQLGLPNHQTS